MNVLIIPGYGDRQDYIDRTTRNWDKRYGIKPQVYVFGWNGEANSYEEKWQRFDEKLQQLHKTAIIGISAGASVAVRALQEHPDEITKVITVCGPVHADKMNPRTLHNRFPVLERSLEHLSLKGLEAKRVMTVRPMYDQLVPIDAMVIDGAQDVRLRMVRHIPSVLLGIFGYGKTMSNFIKEQS
ncbi:MAG TPA: alpha/beta hydrolase [Candidatus Saccharimonadales bacterium]|nr:alpha/beta hydrolase [Candidatus Saccharimonadales bacterium]